MAADARERYSSNGMVGASLVPLSPHLAPPIVCFLTVSPCTLSRTMHSKRLTDHNDADGCRPALNIDVMRIIGVCETAAQLTAAVQKLGETFNGCGRIKV